jgi:hypothetical protein
VRAVSRRKAIQVVGGLTGLAASAILLGVVVVRLTSLPRHTAEVVVAGVTIAGALIGGFIAAPYLSRMAMAPNSTAQAAHPPGRHRDLTDTADQVSVSATGGHRSHRSR